MFAEFKHTLRRLRGQVIGWSLGLGLFSLFMALFWDTVLEMEGLQEMIESYPSEMAAFFGGMTAITTPPGYMNTYYFSMMPVIAGVFGIIAGAGLLAADEEKGILDLVLTYPISRTRLLWARFLALSLGLAIVMVAGWLGWYLPSLGTSMDLSALQFLLPFLSLFAVLLLFAALALLLSMVLPAARLAATLAGVLLVGNFLLVGMAGLDEGLQAIVASTPLHYYQGGFAVAGLKWLWLGGLLLVALLLAGTAWLLFLRRDIRVGGERSWRLRLPFTFTIVLFLLASCTAPQTQPAATQNPDVVVAETPLADMPNPASVFCQEQGYQSEIRTAGDGSQYGVCIFPDGSECDEWAYYRGECSPASQNGPTPAAAEIPTAPPPDPSLYQGWQRYTHAGYGFSIMLPEEWVVEESAASDTLLSGHLLNLHPTASTGQENIRLTVRRVGEETLLWPTGVGQGDFIPQGMLEVAGQPVQRVLLVCPSGEVTAIWYHQGEGQPNVTRGDLEFGFIYSTGPHCEPGSSLSGEAQLVGEMIIASLQVP
jgi:ABC-2 type transport system permease protein